MLKRQPLFLVVDTLTVTPHIETSLEICHVFSDIGRRIAYLPLFASHELSYWHSLPGGHSINTDSGNLTWLKYVIERLPIESDFLSIKFNTPTLPTLESFEQYQSFFYNGLPFGSLVLKFARESFKDRDLNDQNEFIALTPYLSAFLKIAVRSYLAALQLIKILMPDVIVLFNGRTPSTQALLWASRQSDLEVIIHERGPNMGRYELYNDQPSKVETINRKITAFASGRNKELCEYNAKRFYTQLREGRPNYWSSFIADQKSHAIRDHFIANRAKYVVYFLSSLDELDAVVDYSYHGPLGTQAEVLSTLGAICQKLTLPLVVRAHPSQKLKRLEVSIYRQISHSIGAIFIEPDDREKSIELGLGAWRVLTYNSTITWELIFWGAHVRTLGRSIADGDSNSTLIDSTEDLVTFLRDSKPTVDKSFAISFGDYMLESGYPYHYYSPISLGEGTFPVSTDKRG